MHFITRYKKVGVIVPLVCLLGTGLTFVNQPIHAAAAVTTKVSNTDFNPDSVSMNTLKNDLYDRYVKVAVVKPDVIFSSNFATALQNFKDTLKALNIKDNDAVARMFKETILKGDQEMFQNWNPQFTNNKTEYTLDNPKVNNYKDDNIEIAHYKNETSSNQTFDTPSKTEKVTDSLAYTNMEGVKLGTSATTTIKAGIPIAQAEETLTASFEATYNHSETNSVTNETDVTYPSQRLLCKPGYTTSLIVKSTKAEFSGNMSFDVDPDVNDLLKSIEEKFKDHEIINKSQLLYNVYRYSGLPIPSYVTLDDQTKTVSFGKVTANYTGVAGHLSDAKATEVKLESLDHTKKTIIIPLKEY